MAIFNSYVKLPEGKAHIGSAVPQFPVPAFRQLNPRMQDRCGPMIMPGYSLFNETSGSSFKGSIPTVKKNTWDQKKMFFDQRLYHKFVNYLNRII